MTTPVVRLGRRKQEPDEKPRPLKVVVSYVETKEKVLRNAYRLRNFRIPKIGISHDKTTREMEDDRKLKSKLVKTREANPTVEYMIYNKTVMKREDVKAIKEEKERMFKERQAKAAQDKEVDKTKADQGINPGEQKA